MLVHDMVFLKKDGSERKIRFVQTKDLPSEFISGKVRGTGAKRIMTEGHELVWDLDKEDWRVINWDTVQTHEEAEQELIL